MEGSMSRGRPRKNPRSSSDPGETEARRLPEGGFTCKRCFQGKIKCDRGTPCSRCVRLNYPCEPHCVRPGRPRKRADSPGLSARDDVTVRPRGPRSEVAAGPPPHPKRESSSLITASATAESPEGVTPPRAPSLHRVSPPRAAKPLLPEATRWPMHEASDHTCGGLLSRLTPPAPAPRQAPPAFVAGEVRPDLQHQRPPPAERLGLKRPLSPARDGARADTGGQDEVQMEALRRLHLAAVLHQAAADEEERKRRHALMAAAASSQHSSASSARVAAAPAPPPMSSRSVLDLLADGAARERLGSLSNGWPVAPLLPPPPAPRPPPALPLAREVGFHATATLMHMPPSRNSSSHGTVHLDWQQRGGGLHPPAQAHQPPPHQHQPPQQQHHPLRFLQPQQQRQQLPAQESWLRRAMASGVDEPKARGILLSWQYFCLLHAGRDTTDGLLEVMSSSLRLSLPCRVPPPPSQPTAEDTAISAHLKGLYDGLLPHQALCCVQWALASAVPSANQHFTNMFGRIDHDLDQGLVPVSLWARMVESCSEEDYWHLVLQATFNSTGTSDARCLKVRDRHGASFWALCRIGAHASPCGWHAFTCIIIEPTGL